MRTSRLNVGHAVVAVATRMREAVMVTQPASIGIGSAPRGKDMAREIGRFLRLIFVIARIRVIHEQSYYSGFVVGEINNCPFGFL